MNKFKNKIGSNLEKRVFTVEKIETDEANEIVRIVGTISHDYLSSGEGTEIEANIFNEILYDEKITAQDRVSKDLESISIPTEVSADFKLPTIGLYGSIITWSLISENAPITIDGGTIKINNYSKRFNAVIQAEVCYGNYSLYKNFSFTILECDAPIIPNSFYTTWTQTKTKLNSSSFVISILKEKNMFVEAEHNDYIKIVCEKNNTTDVTIIISETELLNNLIQTASIDIDFKLKIYATDEPDIIIKEIPGSIKYIFSSLIPAD